MFALKLKLILLPQLIATLNNYACVLPPLAMRNIILYQLWPLIIIINPLSTHKIEFSDAGFPIFGQDSTY